MASITGSTNEKIYQISKWLGLNEAPDGDTKLRMGEAAKMANWKITRDGNLKRRPGTEFVAGLLSDYDVQISANLREFVTLPLTAEVAVYDDITVESPPGIVSMIGEGGSVIRGELVADSAQVTGNALSLPDSVDAEIEDGVLIIEDSAEMMTVSDLVDALDDLEEGEYLYMLYDEVPYALNANSVSVSGSNCQLSGYIVRAIAGDEITAPEIKGIWSGFVAGKPTVLAACDGELWSLYDADEDKFERVDIGPIATDKGVSFFPFDGKAWILNGYDYYVYDGTNLNTVDGYRPLIAVAISPVVNGSDSESGELTGEYINRLNGKRRVYISPDGTNKTFQMPETDLASIDWVKDLATGNNLTVTTDYTVNLTTGQVTFVNAPAKSVDSYEIAYSVHEYTIPIDTNYYSDVACTTKVDETEALYMGNIYTFSGNTAIAFKISSTTYYAKVKDCQTMRTQVTGNLFAELFAGNQDTGVFIYGDGTNRTLYTGMDEDGLPRADYFPDQFEAHIGDSNTPITAMVRHYGVLMAFKPDSAWALGYGTTELANGVLTVAINITPVNRDKGHLAPGQVRLVNNNPVTCSGTELYQWVNSSYYTSNLTRDERQANRISDRVQQSLREMDLEHCCMCDDNDGQEFYVASNGIILVWNYALDVWYRYEGIDATNIFAFQGDVYIGTKDGTVLRLDYNSAGDEGYPIEAEWESGAMNFGAGNMRKYAAQLWVTLKPVAGTSVDVSIETDRKSEEKFKDKVIAADKARVKGEPFPSKIKIKAKKFVYYRLFLSVTGKQPAVTVTDVQMRVRETGYAK